MNRERDRLIYSFLFLSLSLSLSLSRFHISLLSFRYFRHLSFRYCYRLIIILYRSDNRHTFHPALLLYAHPSHSSCFPFSFIPTSHHITSHHIPLHGTELYCTILLHYPERYRFDLHTTIGEVWIFRCLIRCLE